MQIIIFTLSDKYYGICTDIVEEITNNQNSTNVPNAPNWVEGLINLRGNVVTLVNLSKLLGQEEDIGYNNIIIINNEEEKVGLMVKDVIGVRDIEEEQIQSVNGKINDGIKGIVKIEKELVNIMDIDILLSENEG